MDVVTFGKQIKGHVREDYDCVIAITSTWEGEGKSTLGQQLGRQIVGNEYDIEKATLFNPTIEQMKEKVLSLPKYQVINADEAIKILYKLKWADKMSIFLNQLYALARSRNLVTILCMPRYRDFTEFFRNHKIKFWIHIVERGTAIIMIKSWNPFAKDPWYLDENEKLIEKYIQKKKIYNFSKEDKMKAFGKIRNLVGFLEFEDLTDELSMQYRELRDNHKFDDIELETRDAAPVKLEEIIDAVVKDYTNYLTITARRKGKIKLNVNFIKNTFGLSTRDSELVQYRAERKLIEQLSDLSRAKEELTISNKKKEEEILI